MARPISVVEATLPSGAVAVFKVMGPYELLLVQKAASAPGKEDGLEFLRRALVQITNPGEPTRDLSYAEMTGAKIDEVLWTMADSEALLNCFMDVHFPKKEVIDAALGTMAHQVR